MTLVEPQLIKEWLVANLRSLVTATENDLMSILPASLLLYCLPMDQRHPRRKHRQLYHQKLRMLPRSSLGLSRRVCRCCVLIKSGID